MEYYTKYILLNHLHWNKIGMSKNDVLKMVDEIRSVNIFEPVDVNQVHRKIGGPIKAIDVLSNQEYEQLTYLFLNLSKFTLNDLSFIKYCVNLEEINLELLQVPNLDFLAENLTLKHINCSYNKLTTIDCLHELVNLECLNIEGNSPLSLKPISHLKQLKEIKADLITSELDVFTLLKNNSNINIQYIIPGGETNFEEFIFPYFVFYIKKSPNLLTIFMEAVETPSKFTSELKFPKELWQREEFRLRYYSKIKETLSIRLKEFLPGFTELNTDGLAIYEGNFMCEYELEF